VIYVVLTGGPQIYLFHTGQASITLHAPTSSANYSLITDLWVSQRLPSQLMGKSQIQIQNLVQLLHSLLLWKFFFGRDWEKGGFKSYSSMEILLNTGAPKSKQENINTLPCLKIPELWGHQLSALHKVLNC